MQRVHPVNLLAYESPATGVPLDRVPENSGIGVPLQGRFYKWWQELEKRELGSVDEANHSLGTMEIYRPCARLTQPQRDLAALPTS